MANEGKTVLVTGASTGIGRDCVHHLDRLGFTVYGGVRRESDGEALLEGASERTRYVILDVTVQDHIDAVVEQLSTELGEGGLWGLVNNAGIAIAGPAEVVVLDDWRYQFEVNFFGQIALTQPLTPLLRKAKGRIVNMSSISGVVTSPATAPYSCSKHALEAYTTALRLELGQWGIWACAVGPGVIETPIWTKASVDVDAKIAAMPEQAGNSTVPPLRRRMNGSRSWQRLLRPPQRCRRQLHMP